jgi:hypothetical protein
LITLSDAAVVYLRSRRLKYARYAATNGSLAMDFPNVEYQQRFRILGDKAIPLQYTLTGSNYPCASTTVPFNFDIPLDEESNFVGTTAVISNIADVSFHVLAVANANSGTVPSAEDSYVQYNSRVYLTD